MIIQDYIPLKLYWVSPQQELYDLSESHPLTDRIFTEGRFLALYKLSDQEGVYQLNDVTYIKQSEGRNFSIPDGRLGIRLKYGFNNSNFPFTKTLIIDALRTEGFDLEHGNVLSGITNDDTYIDVDRDLFIRLPDNYNRNNLLGFVNGIYHQTILDPHSNNVYLRDGYHTLKITKGSPSVTFMDFSTNGGVTTLPFKEEWLVSDKDQLDRGGTFHIPDYNLMEYTVCLVNDGRFYLPNTALTVTGESKLQFNTGPLKTYTDFYRSPAQRKTVEFPIESQTAPKSDIVDSQLGFWNNTNNRPVGDMLTPQFILDRLLSPHSAILLLPKGIFFTPYPLQRFDEDPNSWILPENLTPNNSVLVSNGLVTPPVFIRTDSRLKRSFIFDPRSSDHYDDPSDDPLRKVEYAPYKAMNSRPYRQRIPFLCSLMTFDVRT